MASIDRLKGVRTSKAIKAPVVVATQADIALSGLPVIDDEQVADGDRVLVKEQAAAAENGIYVASGGDWSRTTDFNKDDDVGEGTTVYVARGSISGGSSYLITSADPINIGTTDVVFIAAANSATVAVAAAEAAQAAAEAAANSLLVSRGEWAGPGTSYGDLERSIVSFEGAAYISEATHVSGASFAADLAAGNWSSFVESKFDVNANARPTTTGTADAYVLTPVQSVAAEFEGLTFQFQPHLTNNAGCTFDPQIPGFAAAQIVKDDVAGSLVPLEAGDLEQWGTHIVALGATNLWELRSQPIREIIDQISWQSLYRGTLNDIEASPFTLPTSGYSAFRLSINNLRLVPFGTTESLYYTLDLGNNDLLYGTEINRTRGDAVDTIDAVDLGGSQADLFTLPNGKSGVINENDIQHAEMIFYVPDDSQSLGDKSMHMRSTWTISEKFSAGLTFVETYWHSLTGVYPTQIALVPFYGGGSITDVTATVTIEGLRA